MTDPLRPAALAMLGAAALLAGCNQAPEDAAPTPALTTAAPRTADAAGAPLTAGSWLVEETANGASAVFASPAGAPVVRLVCRRADRAVILTRSGVAEATTFRLQAGGTAADLAMAPAAGGAGEVEAVVDPAQPIFAVFADPAATIRMEAPGTPALNLPSHTGIGRVAQACS
jgi:hypothetical protein